MRAYKSWTPGCGEFWPGFRSKRFMLLDLQKGDASWVHLFSSVGGGSVELTCGKWVLVCRQHASRRCEAGCRALTPFDADVELSNLSKTFHVCFCSISSWGAPLFVNRTGKELFYPATGYLFPVFRYLTSFSYTREGGEIVWQSLFQGYFLFLRGILRHPL